MVEFVLKFMDLSVTQKIWFEYRLQIWLSMVLLLGYKLISNLFRNQIITPHNHFIVPPPLLIIRYSYDQNLIVRMVDFLKPICWYGETS